MKQIKRGLVYALTGSMLFSSISPALAYTYKDSVANVEYTDVTENATNNTTVYAEVGSFFKVTIPKHIILNGTTKSGAYTVSVEGDIAGTETVNVVPDEAFFLKSNNLKDVIATIEQDKVQWKYDEMLEGTATIGNGAIDAKDITAGSWNGNFNFNIKLENSLVIQKGFVLSVDGDVALGSEDSLQVNAYIDGVKSNDTVTWTSDNENITVTNGLIETKASAKVGDTATITVTTQDQTELTAMQDTLQTLGLVTYANATNDTSIDFIVTIVDIEYTVESITVEQGGTVEVTAKIVPETASGTVKWSQTAVSGINLVKNGNTVTIKVADDMEAGKSYNLIATYGDYSKSLTINVMPNGAHIHEYTESITKAATCTETGVITYTCTCGDNYTEDIEATGHSYADGNCKECGMTQEAGLYDANGVMLCTYEESGIDVSINYAILSSYSNYYQTTETSGYYVLTKKYPTATTIIFPNNITNIGNYVFNGCTNLTNVVLKNGLTNIGNSAFGDCLSLTSITIPNSVTSIGSNVFDNTAWLKAKQAENPLVIINGILLNGKVASGNIVIPTSVTSINTAAFMNCTKLTNITIPESVKTIGNSAFSGCTSLTDITIQEGVTNIGDYVFKNCAGLSTIEFPNSVIKIGGGTFQNCTGLKSVYIPKTVTTFLGNSNGTSSFYGCSSTLKLYCGASSKPSNWGTYSTYNKDTAVTIKWGVTRATYESTYK